MSPYHTPSSMKAAGIRDSFARRPAPVSGAATGVVVRTLVAVGAAVDVGTDVDVGGGVDVGAAVAVGIAVDVAAGAAVAVGRAVDVGGGAGVGVGDPSHAARINNSVAAAASHSIQSRVLFEFKYFTLLSVAGRRGGPMADGPRYLHSRCVATGLSGIQC